MSRRFELLEFHNPRLELVECEIIECPRPELEEYELVACIM